MEGKSVLYSEKSKTLLSNMVHFNLENMISDVNNKTETIADQVGMTPMEWNRGIFASMYSVLKEFGSWHRGFLNGLPGGCKMPRRTFVVRCMQRIEEYMLQ